MTSRKASLEQALTVRPNTGLPESFFQHNIVVCSGEDPVELKKAMRTVFGGRRPSYHAYRCYRAWKFSEPAITVVLSGIGTGCLEPLMFEMLDADNLGDKVPRRLALIGTAGYLADSGFGQVYVVEGAYPVGCAVVLDDADLPVRPVFEGLDSIQLPRAEEISSDYYYGCTTQESDPRKMLAKSKNPALRAGLEKYWQSNRLIAMETAQFYHFAQCYGAPDTQYVALRGVANLADQFETQGKYSQQVLTDALQQAVGLLSL